MFRGGVRTPSGVRFFGVVGYLLEVDLNGGVQSLKPLTPIRWRIVFQDSAPTLLTIVGRFPPHRVPRVVDYPL